MSYDVYLLDDSGELLPCDPFEDGGTYVMGGTDRCELNVTYNYGKHIWPHIDGGLKALDGERAGDWEAVLARAVDELGTDRSDDYWEPTAGNAGAALARLLVWARAYPEAVFHVS